MSLCFHKEKSLMSLEEMKAVLSLHPDSEVNALSKHSEWFLPCCKAAAFSAQPCRCPPAPQRITRLFPPLVLLGKVEEPRAGSFPPESPSMDGGSAKQLSQDHGSREVLPSPFLGWKTLPPSAVLLETRAPCPAEPVLSTALLQLSPHSHQCLQNLEYNRESGLPLLNCFAFNNPYPCLWPIFRLESFQFLSSSWQDEGFFFLNVSFNKTCTEYAHLCQWSGKSALSSYRRTCTFQMSLQLS